MSDDLFALLAESRDVLLAPPPLSDGLFGATAVLDRVVSRTELWRAWPAIGEVDDLGWPETKRAARCTPMSIQRAIDTGGKTTTEARGACLGCGWVSDTTHVEQNQRFSSGEAERLAIEDAHDHSHPGWRDLLALDRPANLSEYDRAATRDWGVKIAPLLPAGWLEAGGPVLTVRDHALRPRAGGAPGGGFDLAARARPKADRIEGRTVHLLPLERGRGSAYRWDGNDLVFDAESGMVVEKSVLDRRAQQARTAAKQELLALLDRCVEARSDPMDADLRATLEAKVVDLVAQVKAIDPHDWRVEEKYLDGCSDEPDFDDEG